MRISAHFDTFDEAETCARALKHHCEGINAIRIRKRGPQDGEDLPIGDPPVTPIPFALYNGATTIDNVESSVVGGPYAGMMAMDFALEDRDPDQGERRDGPAGRRECVMDVLAQPYAAREIEQTILNGHGRRLQRVQL